MNRDDERRLLLALAACVLGDLLDQMSEAHEGPSVESRIQVVRSCLEPFKDFMAEDRRRMEKDMKGRTQ